MRILYVTIAALAATTLLAACAPTRPHPDYHQGYHDVYEDTHTTETHIERRPVGEEFIVE